MKRMFLLLILFVALLIYSMKQYYFINNAKLLDKTIVDMSNDYLIHMKTFSEIQEIFVSIHKSSNLCLIITDSLEFNSDLKDDCIQYKKQNLYFCTMSFSKQDDKCLKFDKKAINNAISSNITKLALLWKEIYKLGYNDISFDGKKVVFFRKGFFISGTHSVWEEFGNWRIECSDKKISKIKTDQDLFNFLNEKDTFYFLLDKKNCRLASSRILW